MSFEIKGILSQGDITYEVRTLPGTGTESYVDLTVTLFSSRFSRVDFELEYRSDSGSPWESDFKITASSSGNIEGNKVRGAECSTSGNVSKIRWRHLDNGIAPGSNCEIRIILLPFPYFFEKCRHITNIEGGTDFGNPLVIGGMSHSAIGIDHNGNWMCVGINQAYILSPSLEIILDIPGLDAPTDMYAKQDGNYLILETGASRILEVDAEGVTVKSWELGANGLDPLGMCYDESTGNILITGGSVPKAYEISWEADLGTILWSFGKESEGMDLDELNKPSGICYGYKNRNKVIIADTWNNRVLIIDRSGLSDTVVPLSAVEIEGESVPLFLPFHVSNGEEDGILISERAGKELLFSEDRSVHPTLVRYNSSKGVSTSGVDSTSPYRNILYTPLPETVAEDI